MGYCTLEDVVEANKGRWPLGTIPASSAKQLNATQVQDFIDQTAAVIDGILRQQGYTLPIGVTASSALKLLEGYNALGAACLVEKASPTPKPTRDGDSVCVMWREAQKMLKAGDLDLGAPVETTGDRMPRYAGNPSPWLSMDNQY